LSSKRIKLLIRFSFVQRQASSRIANLSRQLENTTATVADITFAESALKDDLERKKSTEDAFNNADYSGQLAQKSQEHKQLEETRELLHAELASLNAQADTRAKLHLRRTERGRKEEAVQSLVDRNRDLFKRYAKAEPSRETMEGEVNGLIA
jgi:DNA repair protein RAD50